jgi:hypothetical protein
MVYDSLCWGESKALAGLVVLASKGPVPHVYTGNTITLRKGQGTPIVVALGATSITKPNGSAIAGNRSYGTNKFCGPGSLYFGQSEGSFMCNIAVPFQEGEILTGYAANTSVAENTILQVDVGYGSAHKRPNDAWDAMAAAGGGELWCVPTSATAAAAVTPAVIGTLDGLTTDTGDMWLDTRASYKIIGYTSCVGVTSTAQSLIFNGLGGDWAGYTPALPGSGITATFDCSGTTFAYEGIPFDGDALPSYMANSLSNTAILGGLMLAKQK